MIKVKVNNEYKDVVKIFGGGTLQKEIIKVWSREAQEYVYESLVEYTGTLPITITANGNALLDYRIYGASGGVGEPTENLYSKNDPDIVLSAYLNYAGNICRGKYGDAVKVSGYIPINGGQTYTGTNLMDSGNGNYYAYYDTNKQLLKKEQVFNNMVFNSPINAAYIRTTLIHRNSEDIAMLTKGSTAPTSYIPYGYKLPMTVYKQEFKITNDMLDQSNWTLSPPHGGYEQRYFMYFDISASISKEECDAKVYKNFTDGYVPKKLVVALTDDIYPTVDMGYRILTNNGVILNKEFDFSSWNKVYLCIGYGDGFHNNTTKQLKIDELFENWKILIAPVSQTQTVPVYIGENQLDSVEGVADYVDKASGKIVRMIGEYTFTGDESFNKYGNSDVFYTSTTINPVGITTVNTTTMRCDHPAFTAIENKDTRYWLNPEADDICCFLPGGMSQVFLRSTSNFTTAAECKAYLKAQFDNGTPVKISYWLKTPVEEDPPVPLPDIPTVGETIIDYDGTPKPSQMYIKYRR